MLTGTYAGFDLEIRGKGIALITFNRPEQMNGFDWAMKRDLTEAMLQLQYDDETRVVVFTGTGKSFCAGDNINNVTGEKEDIWKDARAPRVERQRYDHLSTYSSLRTISQGLTRAVRDLDKLTIAAINGFAIQSGLTLALACDFRLATPEAKLGSATLRMGFQPDENGHYLLVQHLGVARTKDFLFKKRIVGGREALALGLVNEVVEQGKLLPRALEFAAELAEGPQVAMRLLKHAVDNAAEMTFDQAAKDIAVRTAISDHHADAKEGAQAFRDKRKPDFA